MRIIIVCIIVPPEVFPPNVAPECNPLIARVIPSAQLFAGRREIVILHNGREYRLRLTQTGKLSSPLEPASQPQPSSDRTLRGAGMQTPDPEESRVETITAALLF